MNKFTEKMIDAKTVQEKIQICTKFEDKAIEENNWSDAVYYLGLKHGLQTSSGLSIGKFIEKIFEFYMKNNAVDNRG